MQFLGVPPRTAVAIFAQVLNHQPHIFEMTHSRIWVPEPKTARMASDQGHCAVTQLLWRRCGRRHLVKLFVLGSHAHNLRMDCGQGKESLGNNDPESHS